MSDDRRRADVRPGLRLSARLVARRTLHRVCAPSRRCDRAVATRPGEPQDAATHADQGRAASAAVFAGRRPHRVRVHGGQRPLQSVTSRSSTQSGLGTPRAVVAPRESSIARYYYSTHDHTINPSWTPDGKSLVFVSNRESRLRHGTDLQRRARGGQCAVVLHQRGDELARESGSGARRPACAVQQLSRPAMASAVGDDAEGRSHAAADVRRVRRHAGALVARRSPRRLHQQRDRATSSLWMREFIGGERRKQSMPSTRQYARPMAPLTIKLTDDGQGKLGVRARQRSSAAMRARMRPTTRG